MAKVPESIEIRIKAFDIPAFEAFIEKLKPEIKNLSPGLKADLEALLDCDVFEFDCEALGRLGINPCQAVVMVDGKKLDGVISVNPYLKRITVSTGKVDGDEIESVFQYPNTLKLLTVDGALIAGW